MSESEKQEKKAEKLEEEIELALKKLDLVQRHRARVMENCDIIGRKLIQEGEIGLGIRLIANSYVHDDPKLTSPLQFKYLFQNEDKDMLKLAIEEHNTTCDHHLSFYTDINSVPTVKIAEIVADLSARSAEQGTCLKDYLDEIYYPKYNIKKNSNLSYSGMLFKYIFYDRFL